MGILESYDLKINGMGRVVYLKKTQHDSQPTVLYLISEMKHAPSLHLGEKGREDLEAGLASIKKAFDGCPILDHRPPEIPHEFPFMCGSHLLVYLIPHCGRKNDVSKIIPAAEFFEETEIFQR